MPFTVLCICLFTDLYLGNILGYYGLKDPTPRKQSTHPFSIKILTETKLFVGKNFNSVVVNQIVKKTFLKLASLINASSIVNRIWLNSRSRFWEVMSIKIASLPTFLVSYHGYIWTVRALGIQRPVRLVQVLIGHIWAKFCHIRIKYYQNLIFSLFHNPQNLKNPVIWSKYLISLISVYAFGL